MPHWHRKQTNHSSMARIAYSKVRSTLYWHIHHVKTHKQDTPMQVKHTHLTDTGNTLPGGNTPHKHSQVETHLTDSGEIIAPQATHSQVPGGNTHLTDTGDTFPGGNTPHQCRQRLTDTGVCTDLVGILGEQ